MEEKIITYRAAIFDLDGTLLNTLDDIADAANSVLIRFDFPQHDPEAYKHFIGEGIETLFRRALPKDKLNEPLIGQCVAIMGEEYGKRWANKTHPYREIPEILDALTIRGIKMAVLSNKPDEFTKQMVTPFLPTWHFAVIQGGQLSVPKKPDPTAALGIADALKVPPHEFLFLGDSDVDMKTALAAGICSVGVLWGFRTAEELLSSGAKVLIGNSEDLITVLKQ